MNPIDIACDYESLNVIVRDLDVKIANLERKIQGKPNKANDLKNSGPINNNRHNHNNNNNNNNNSNNNNNGNHSNSRFSSQSNLDSHELDAATNSDDSGDDDGEEEEEAIVQVRKKNDPIVLHLDSLKKIRTNILASLDTLDKQKKTALKITQVDTMKRNVDDINKLKWLLTVLDTLKHLNEEAKKELLTCPVSEEGAVCENQQETEQSAPKEPLLTTKQLELIEKSIPFICPSRIDYDAKFSVQLDTSSKFIMHLSEGKRKEALPGINFRNLKELLKKVSEAPYFSDRQRHQKTRNNSPEQGNTTTNISSEKTVVEKQEIAPATAATNEKPADNKTADNKTAEQTQNEEDKLCDESVPKDSSDHSEKVNNNSGPVFDIKKMPEILSVDGDSESPKPDQANDNTQDDQSKNATRANHGYPPRRGYDNSRGRPSRGGGGSRYNDRRRNYHQYDRKEFPQRGSDGAERPEYGNQNSRHHQSSHRYKHSQNKNMGHGDHNGTVPTGNGSNGTTMVYPNLQNDNSGLVHDPAVIAASLSHPNGGTINVHAMQNTAHTIMY